MKATSIKEWYLETLSHLEDNYKFCICIRGAIDFNKIKVDPPFTSTYGNYTLVKEDFNLDEDQLKRSGWISQNNAILVLAIHLSKFMQRFGHKEFKNDIDWKHAHLIVKHIRNAWAHDPFNPMWDIKKPDEQIILKVEDIITLDATKLDGNPVQNRQFGFSHALLKLSEYVRSKFQFSQSITSN